MSKSKVIVLSTPSPKTAAALHQTAIGAAQIYVASAVLCGLELQAVKAALKKQGGMNFLEWFERHESELGFSVRTKDKYMLAAMETKSKLLKSGDKSVIALLDKSPKDLGEAGREKLFKAVEKCVGTKTIADLLIEARLTRDIHKAPLRLTNGDDSETDHHNVPVEQLVQEQLDLFGQRSLDLKKKHKLGKQDVLLISRWPKTKLDTAIGVLKADLQLLIKVKGSIK